MLIQYNLEYPNTLVIRIWESVRQFVSISEIKTFHNQNTQGILFLFIRMYFQEYISSLKLVHRDLACRNILIAENKQLKISDFGLTRETEIENGSCENDEEYYRIHFHKDKLPVRWMALESITQSIFSTKSDV